MKAIEACLLCDILISKHTPHGKKKNVGLLNKFIATNRERGGLLEIGGLFDEGGGGGGLKDVLWYSERFN